MVERTRRQQATEIRGSPCHRPTGVLALSHFDLSDGQHAPVSFANDADPAADSPHGAGDIGPFFGPFDRDAHWIHGGIDWGVDQCADAG